MKVIRLAILGLGNVPLALLRYISEPGRAKTLKEAGIVIRLTGVTTGSRGNAINPEGISLQDLAAIGKSGKLAPLNKGPLTSNSLEFVKAAPADILFVATPASIPSVEEIKLAFVRGIHVVTSNKTPVANHFRKLKQDATKHGVGFRFGATVLAGYPPWGQFFEAISKQPITELQIVVNATSNQILTMMLEEGKSFDEGIKKAQEQGIAERDPSDDVDGHDTQKKLAILANVLMDANLSPADIPTVGIRGVTLEQLKAVNTSGKWIQLLGRAWFEKGQVKAEVKPVETDNPFFASMRGTSMGLFFKTAAANFGIRLDLGSGDQAIMATAAGVFEDILTLAKQV